MSHVHKIKFLTFQSICALFSLAAGLNWGIVSEFAKYKNRLFDNTMISNIDVGGKTPAEAKKILLDSYVNPLLDQSVEITLAGQTYKTSLRNFFEESNLDETIHQIECLNANLSTLEKCALLSGNASYNVDLHMTFNDEAIEEFIDSIATSDQDTAECAKIYIDTKGAIALTPSRNGYTVDRDKLKTSLIDATTHLTGLTMEDTYFTTPILPDISTTDLQSIDALISSSVTSFTPNGSRETNISLCTQAINNTLLMPGDTFKFNDLVGDTTLEKGYKNAATYANGEVIQTPGGGICQVSSTLYDALLATDLEIDHRKPHSRPVSYVPLGLDATISWGSIDLVFHNNLNYPVYIKAYVKDNAVHIDLYSNHSLNEKSYKVYSKTLDILESSVRYLSDATLPKGTKQLIQSGKSGYIVEVTRETYEQDQLKSVEVISTDTYPSSNTVYRIGIG